MCHMQLSPSSRIRQEHPALVVHRPQADTVRRGGEVMKVAMKEGRGGAVGDGRL